MGSLGLSSPETSPTSPEWPRRTPEHEHSPLVAVTAPTLSDHLVYPGHGLLHADVRGPAPGPAHVGLHPARVQHEEGEVGVLHRQARSQHVLH